MGFLLKNRISKLELDFFWSIYTKNNPNLFQFQFRDSIFQKEPKTAKFGIFFEIFQRYSGWNQAHCQCIVQHESAGNSHAVNENTNGSLDVGVWQINSVNWGQW